MAVASLDWFPLYIDKWTGESVKCLSLRAQGAYMAILCHQFKEGSVPSDVNKLARCIGADPAELAEALEEIRAKFTEVDGRLVNEPMAQIKAEQEQKNALFKASGVAGANKRWGGNKPSDSPPNSPPIRVSDSPPNATLIALEEKRREENTSSNQLQGGTRGKRTSKSKGNPQADLMVSDFLPEEYKTEPIREVWVDFTKYRREKGQAPYKAMGLTSFATMVQTNGITPEQFPLMVKHCMASNWNGIPVGIIQKWMAEHGVSRNGHANGYHKPTGEEISNGAMAILAKRGISGEIRAN